MFPVMFAIPRTAGWLAQWLEGIQDSEQKIARPRQIYTGSAERNFIPIDERRTEPTVTVSAWENP
jgi:citrate synthase